MAAAQLIGAAGFDRPVMPVDGGQTRHESQAFWRGKDRPGRVRIPATSDLFSIFAEGDSEVMRGERRWLTSFQIAATRPDCSGRALLSSAPLALMAHLPRS